MTNRNKNDKAHRYRKSRNIYAAAAAAVYIAGGLLAVAARTRAALIAVSILAGLVTLVLISLAVLYGRGASRARLPGADVGLSGRRRRVLTCRTKGHLPVNSG